MTHREMYGRADSTYKIVHAYIILTFFVVYFDFWAHFSFLTNGIQ